MAIHIEWDEFEIALLIEACEEVLGGVKRKAEAVRRLSSDLRRRAVSKGVTIDEVFRNENGISVQMQKMDYLLTHGEKGLPGASKLYAKMAEIRETNPQKFVEILKRAKEEIDMSDLPQQNSDRRAQFVRWLNAHPIKKYTPNLIIDALDEASNYCIAKGIFRESIWEIQDKQTFNKGTSKLLSSKIFRLIFHSVAITLDTAFPLYRKFLWHGQTPNVAAPVQSKGVITAPIQSKAAVTAIEKKEEAAAVHAVYEEKSVEPIKNRDTASDDGSLKLNLYNIGDLSYSKPSKLIYEFQTFTDFSNWANIYVKIVTLLKHDYPQIIVDSLSLTGDRGTKPEFSKYPEMLRAPKYISDDLYVEVNHSAPTIAKRIGTLLDLCGISRNDVEIYYKSKNNSSTAPKTAATTRLFDTLYDISRIYTEPDGVSFSKIMHMLKGEFNEKLVRNILNHVPWATMLDDNTYRFTGSQVSRKKEETLTPKTPFAKFSRISSYEFCNYLEKKVGLSASTCNSYASSVNTAQAYAKNHRFETYRIYDTDIDEAINTINLLLSDSTFCAYNLKQGNRFRAALTKFAEMAGRDISFTKPTCQNTATHKPKPLTDFDKEKYVEVLMSRYRNGITFDSIDFDNFREIYQDFNDCGIDVDDATLEKQLRLCGVFYNDRLFPAEGIMDDTVKAKLFGYIENSFASGKKVLYYKAIFEDLADDFASCYTLADENMLRAFIEFTAEDGKYYFFKDYMSIEAGVKIDNTAEVEEFLLSAGKPMKVEDVCTALTHIPEDKVDSIIKFDSRFRRNAKGEYFHIDIFEISEQELEKIAAIIDGFITENDYAIWTDVWNKIQETMTVFLENNLYLSGLGVRNAISSHYLGRFNFDGAVISRPNDCYGMRDVYQLYAKHHPTFTADDIYILSKELDTGIYFDALSEVSVRVSHDLFITKDQISFDADAVDRAIGSFLSKDYIRIREIDSYLVFPNVGYEWNEYLLESFLLSYSKKFELLNNGLSLNNVAGFVVNKNGQIKEFVDACAYFLADGRIELKKADALNYLASTNVISRRSYKDIDLALRRATQIRARKG